MTELGLGRAAERPNKDAVTKRKYSEATIVAADALDNGEADCVKINRGHDGCWELYIKHI